MNFKIVSNNKFSADLDFFTRTYYLLQKSSGLIKISNVLSGKVLFDNLNPGEITINGSAMINIDELQNVVYNKSCFCKPDNEVDEKKIFDKTFGKTFQ